MTDVYPLSDTYTLWFHHVNDNNWSEESYIKLMEICSLKDLWEIRNSLPNVTSGMFFLMRDTISPRWEDINNIDGGYWTFRVMKKDSSEVWYNLMSALVGNTLTKDSANYQEINGISISPKINNAIIKIWNNDATKHSSAILAGSVPGIVPEEAHYRKHQEQADFNNPKVASSTSKEN